MRIPHNLSQKVNKLIAGILKSDAEGNISAASSSDIAACIAPGTFAASNHNHNDTYAPIAAAVPICYRTT